MLRWYRQISGDERRTLWACYGGWALDAFDSQMFGVALPALIGAFALGKAQAGLLGSVTLASSAAGGWIAGALSDRFGRVRVFQATILWFSGFSLLGGLAQTYTQLLVLRACHGLGFGGEWTAGAVLLAEAIRPEHRGKALGFVQSAWAVGWAASVIAYAILFTWLPPAFAWRVLFAAGALPALLVVRLRGKIPEKGQVRGRAPRDGRVSFLGIFSPALLRTTVVGALLGVGAHGGYYALMTWLPTYLKTERRLSVLGTSGYLAVIIAAFWIGCLVSAALQDRIGRRLNMAAFAVGSVITVLSTCLPRSRITRCSCSASRSGSSQREFPQPWGRFSTSSILENCAARASASATILAGWPRPAFLGWSGS